ncbi:MAG: hypothetical protein J7J89_04085 [Thermoplasmata archaeon]|nr:hypothetical protein [Thermoplasmata archaeon]
MAKGKWSFIHEWTIYEYLMARFEDGTLRLKKKIEGGNVVRKDKWVKVYYLEQIIGTDFPDIKKIQLSKNNIAVPAEVKFTTSRFNCHKGKKHFKDFEDFISKHGIIIVVSHDYLPPDLAKYNIDVYELDKTDFISFCRENFSRFLSRQIKLHYETKYWLMYQGPNFNKGTNTIKPARESHIWCPTDNLTGFDLAIGDRVLFVKTSGASTQKVQKSYREHNEIYPDWILDEIWVGEITSTIYSRYEYAQIKSYDYQNTRLWKNDPKRNNEWRWNRVFEFKPITVIKISKKLSNLYKDEYLKPFVDALVEVFCYNKSRELSPIEYQHLLEKIR